MNFRVQKLISYGLQNKGLEHSSYNNASGRAVRMYSILPSNSKSAFEKSAKTKY